ncbi:MAG: hypothetical protein INH41_17120 [Myxococcaceae bacterium]|jgi:hypothetical protein|nr:hypothetical protein [Myxococcaceae bacterium]MCA3014105.1 hypothetical protein [Myxococcaceae bacterium]
MRRAVLLLGLLSGMVWASPFEPEVTQASIDGSSKGKVDFRAAAGLIFRPEGSQVLVRASYKSTLVDGVGTLLSGRLDNPDTFSAGKNWEVGGIVTWVKNGFAPNADQLQTDAWKSCAEDCAKRAGSEFCTWYDQYRAISTVWDLEKDRVRVADKDFCKDAGPALKKLEEVAGRIAALKATGVDVSDAELKYRSERGRLWRECRKACDDPFTTNTDPDWCERSKPETTSVPLPPAPPLTPKGLKLCEKGLQLLRDADAAPLLPAAMLNLGARGGQASYTFLSSSEPGPLVKQETRYDQWTAGLSGWLTASRPGTESRGRLTFEAIATVGSRFEPTSTTSRFCVPRGTVQTEQGEVPLERCSEIAEGRPTRSTTVRLALFAGWTDQQRFRVAGGLDGAVSALDGTVRLSAAFPLVANVVEGGEYKGLLRITPSIGFQSTPGSPVSPSFQLTLELLGQRGLFTEDFDKL